MWNKSKERIKELENEIGWLNKNYNDARRDLEKIKLKESQEPRKSVYVCLKNNKTITIYDADDFGYTSGDDMLKIVKNNEIIGLIKIEDIIAISNNPISVGDNEYFYTVGGMRI